MEKSIADTIKEIIKRDDFEWFEEFVTEYDLFSDTIVKTLVSELDRTFDRRYHKFLGILPNRSEIEDDMLRTILEDDYKQFLLLWSIWGKDMNLEQKVTMTVNFPNIDERYMKIIDPTGEVRRLTEKRRKSFEERKNRDGK